MNLPFLDPPGPPYRAITKQLKFYAETSHRPWTLTLRRHVKSLPLPPNSDCNLSIHSRGVKVFT